MQGFQLGNHAAIHPGKSRLRWRLELGQFNQGEQVGGAGCQGLVRVGQILQPRPLVPKPGQIDAAVTGLAEPLIGCTGQAPQTAVGARVAMELAEDPGGFAAAGRPGISRVWLMPAPRRPPAGP
jgi:hypothetical protein